MLFPVPCIYHDLIPFEILPDRNTKGPVQDSGAIISIDNTPNAMRVLGGKVKTTAGLITELQDKVGPKMPVIAKTEFHVPADRSPC